jgi:protein-disulfide isomerase
LTTKIRIFAAALVLAIAAMAVAQPNSPAANMPNEATIMGFLQQMFGYDSAISYKISSMKPAEAPGFTDVTVILTNPQGDQALNFFVSPDGKFALVGQLLDFGADPFSRYRNLLKDANGPIKGPKNAKVTMVEFADLECPACKAALPNLEKMQSENPDVKVIFQNYPLEKLHPWAFRAALYVDCLKSNNDVAWKFVDSVYAHQEEIKDENADAMLKTYATEAGADNQIAACIADPKTKANVYASEKLGDSLAVNSTPTIFLNGRKISSFNSLPYDTFKQLTDFAIKNAK